MKTAKDHISSIALDMAKTMFKIDNSKTEFEHFSIAYDFLLCRFALWNQKASLLNDLLIEEVLNENANK